jgi:hypothetical protein
VVTELVGIAELPKHILLREQDKELGVIKNPETC